MREMKKNQFSKQTVEDCLRMRKIFYIVKLNNDAEKHVKSMITAPYFRFSGQNSDREGLRSFAILIDNQRKKIDTGFKIMQ